MQPGSAGLPPMPLPEAPPPGGDAHAAPAVAAHVPVPAWLAELRRDARRRLEAHEPEVWEHLSRQFEASLIQTALEITRGRRIEAAQRLGIGRNTITRKIQELGLPD
jgi:two-component system nitrogen regulation response regulator GlnG